MTGGLYAVLSLTLFVTASFLVGFSLQALNPMVVAFLYFGGGSIAALCLLLHRKKLKQDIAELIAYPKKLSLPMLFATTMDGLCWFIGVALIGISGQAITGRLVTLFLLLYGLLILKEKLSKMQQVFAILIIIAGGLFILSLNFNIELIGFLIASTGSLFHAIFNIYQKKTAHDIDGLCVLMTRCAFLALIALLFCLVLSVNIYENIIAGFNAYILLVLAGGIMGIFVHYTRTKALKTERLSIVSLIIGTSPIFTYTLGVFILNEPSDPLKTLAAIIMISSVLILGITKSAPFTKKT